MIFRLINTISLPLYVTFLVVSAAVLEKAWNVPLLILLGILFVAGTLTAERFPRHFTAFSVLQAALLFTFHIVSQMNWVYTLYIILLVKLLTRVEGFARAALTGCLMMAVYTAGRLTYTPITTYNALAAVSDFLTSVFVALLLQYIIRTEREKNALMNEKGREEQLFESAKARVVGELAAGMAHEIRNPLTSIKGFLQLSQKNGYSIEPWYDMLLAEVDRMNELTGEFLQLSKPHTASCLVRSLHDCLIRVISLSETDAHSRGHRIVFEEAEEGILVRMEMDKLVQVFLNLVKNAVEAMTSPGTVTIRLYREEDMAVVEVKDTGAGISKADLKKIFTPFFTTKENGTGLGLSICQKIILDHGGTLGVSSEWGKGTAFAVRLPVAHEKEEE